MGTTGADVPPNTNGRVVSVDVAAPMLLENVGPLVVVSFTGTGVGDKNEKVGALDPLVDGAAVLLTVVTLGLTTEKSTGVDDEKEKDGALVPLVDGAAVSRSVVVLAAETLLLPNVNPGAPVSGGTGAAFVVAAVLLLAVPNTNGVGVDTPNDGFVAGLVSCVATLAPNVNPPVVIFVVDTGVAVVVLVVGLAAETPNRMVGAVSAVMVVTPLTLALVDVIAPVAVAKIDVVAEVVVGAAAENKNGDLVVVVDGSDTATAVLVAVVPLGLEESDTVFVVCGASQDAHTVWVFSL